ncbi:MAG: putative iron-regulated protein [Rhodothermales bacterium]|jgi:uncharacterized iron-regulated protein
MIRPLLLVAVLGTSPGYELSAAGSTDVLADTVTADHYRIYTGEGQPVSWEELVSHLLDADVVFIGENHNDPVAHYIEQAVLGAALADESRRTAASMEMFTRDVQYIVDEYLHDMISEDHFRRSSTPWRNYEVDYRPFVEMAKEAGAAVIAANAPRRYANRVTRMGPESVQDLSDAARKYLAPLPYSGASDAYRAEWDAVMAEAMAGMMQQTDSSAAEGEDSLAEGSGGSQHNYAMGYALDAQSLWDATMAFSIADHLTRNPGSQVVHIVGGFHVQNGTGIPEHFQRYRPGSSRVIIAVEPVEDIATFDHGVHHGLGDFVILGDASLPRSY